MNVSERRLERVIRALGLEVVPQAQVGRYTVDFLLPRIRVIVEVDSLLYHSRPDDARRDRLRDYNLQDLGFTTVHVWTHDLLTMQGRRKVKRHILRRLTRCAT